MREDVLGGKCAGEGCVQRAWQVPLLSELLRLGDAVLTESLKIGEIH